MVDNLTKNIMNRMVELVLNKLNQTDFARLLMYVIENRPDKFSLHKRQLDIVDRLPDPFSLVKYALRVYPGFTRYGVKISLSYFSQPIDPYEVIEFKCFSGHFIFDEKQGGFVPSMDTVKGTRTMKKIWDKLETKRIKKVWMQSQSFRKGLDKEMQNLIYECMQRGD